jgi:hypothetical protein
MGQYINLTQNFFDSYQFFGDEVAKLYAVRTLNGMLVTDPNTINEFPQLFDTTYDFIEVNVDFYNQYNGMILIPEKLYLFVRLTNDNKYVVESIMSNYFGQILPVDSPITQIKLTDLQDFYVNLEWEDFDHSNDIV